MKEIKVKQLVMYDGHNLKANGSVNLKLKARYSELTNTIQLMQLLNNDVEIVAKLPDKKAMNLGLFRIQQIVIDGDGESVLKFNGISDYIEMDNLNQLPLNSDDIKEFKVMFKSQVEIEKEENEEE